MREIIPYKTVAGAMKALDNGGRFFNLFTKSDDGLVTSAELSKAAGVIFGRDRMFLHLEMSLDRFQLAQRDSVLSRLAPDLRSDFDRATPERLAVDAFESVVEAGQAVIVSGYPRFLEDRTEFVAFIMVPISTGKTTTFTMIPIFDRFDVYEVFPDERMEGTGTIIATVRGSRRLEPVLTVFGGLVRDLKFKTKAENPHKHYLETLYYIRNPSL